MRLPALLILMVPLVGCLHARTTDANRSEAASSKENDKKSDDKKSDDKKSDDKKSEAKKEQQPSGDKPGKAATSSHESASDSKPNKPSEAKSETHSKEGTISEPGHPILSISPEGLRKPGGTMQIKKALNKAGFLHDVADSSEEDLRQALIKFQEKHQLAKTGFADHETIRKLGLNPKDVDLSQMPRKSEGGT